MPTSPSAEAAAEPLALVTALRTAGIEVPVSASAIFAEALGELDLGRGASLYWAARLCLVRSAADLEVFDRAFAAHILGAGPTAPDDAGGTDQAAPRRRGIGDGIQLDVNPGDRVRGASVAETLRERDVARCTPGELAEIAAAIDRLRWTSPQRSARRWDRSSGSAGLVDLRRAVAEAARNQGEVVDPPRRRRQVRRRRLLLVLDVSGSMAPYAAVLLRLGHVAVRATGGEVYTVGTRLTRVTAQLTDPRPDRAVRDAASAAADWGGGTRLGACLAELVAGGDARVARGAVAVVLSDGWEREDPDALGRAAARLARLAHRLIWVNPLRATPGYEPLAAGMAAALPHCDRFVDGHSLAAVEELVALLVELG